MFKLTLLLLGASGLTACGADKAALLNGAPQERAAAIQAAGFARDASSVGELAKAALDSDPVVAYAAAEALGAIGTEQAAEALLKAWASGSPAALGSGMLRCAEARREAKDTARARALYAACREKGAGAQQAAAALGLSSLEPQPADAAKPSVLEKLRDESELVRLTGIHAAVREADASALPLLFALSLKPDETGRAATLALAAMAAPGTDEMLYGEMKREGPERAKAIELLAARGEKGLARRLCDASLYGAVGANTAAGGAWRSCLRQEDFAPALAFAFGPLPAQQRDPLVSALASVAQQLPDQARVVRELGEQLAKAEAASKAEVLGLLAGLQTEAARELLAAQATSDDVDLRKAAVRVFSKWNSPLAVAPLLGIATRDSDRGVKILAARGLLALVQKPNLVDTKGRLAVLSQLAAAAERVEEKKAVFDLVKTMGGKEAEALRAQLAEACGAARAQERVVAAVNAGGGAVGAFQADTGFSGGSVYAVKLEVDLSEARDPAPEEVYQSCRFKDATYAFDGLKAGQPYTLRLHFAETFHQRAGARVFDVDANGQTVLTDYDIVAKTGVRMKAVTESFEVKADAGGRLAVAFKTRRDQALVNGLEVLEAGEAGRKSEVGDRKSEVGDRKSEVGGRKSEVGDRKSEVGDQRSEGGEGKQGGQEGAAANVRSAPRPGQIRVLLMTGANNHNWQETTPALKAILAESPKFFVTVVENPWEMKPVDIEGFDLIFNNWNTYGKDKREWAAEMKAAFMAWVKKGGGFFVLHAGGSMFYDWEEFQTLTGGAWDKDTFHPRPQAFAVSIADKAHPVTRGMADFETFDEPWQKIGNRNPSRRVLLTGVVSKENKGSGEPEPFAWVTERGKGRCFNLVLGHDAKALNNASCKALILRGSEWAATGSVNEK